jgi:four helix bundle protein
MQMAFEQLDVHRVALDVARWMVQQRFPRGLSDLKNQGVRASASVVLNIAEGNSRRGKARTNHFQIARGSAAEALALLLIVELPGWQAQADKLRRVDRMLSRMGG